MHYQHLVSQTKAIVEVVICAYTNKQIRINSQAICTGGTTQSQITPANKKFFYPNGGCSIKTEPYSQNLEYVPWDSPNTGQGGSEDAAACCANALSLCEYVGDRNSQNYIQLLATTNNFCVSFVPSQTRDATCAWFNNPQNCGSTTPIG